MVDEIKGKKIVKIIKIILVIIILLLIVIFAYLQIQTNISTKNYKKYLEENGYKKSEGNKYTKQITNGTTTTEYFFYENEFVLSKSITKKEKKATTITSLTYDNNNTIEINYNIEGINNSNQYTVGIQKATYNSNNYDCKIVLKNDFDIKCDELKKEAIEFEKETQELLKYSKAKAKYIK